MNYGDSRPFIDLQKDSEEFQAKFNEDIQECLSLLDEKISNLLVDPDSLVNPASKVKQSVLLEFSKAKYNIFIDIKTIINTKEREWLSYISEMKKLFIENVEIFLAGTKLEVKLPPAESQSSPGSSKSPGRRQAKSPASSVASSVLPIISSIAKNIPGLSSPRPEKDAKGLSSPIKKSTANTAHTYTRYPASNMRLSEEDSQDDEDMDEAVTETSQQITTSRMRLNPCLNEEEKEEEIDDTMTIRAPTRSRKGVKNINETSNLDVTTARTPAKAQRNLKNINEPSKLGSTLRESNLAESNDSSESEIESPVARPTKPSARRKTLLPNLEEISGSDIIPGNPTRSASKRKTIGGVSELGYATPAKRLKPGSRKSVVPEAVDDNLLESDDNYSAWMTLKDVDGKVPTLPAIYEVKVWRAKKPAYIGFCESLRQRLTLYKLRQNSGHKHLDKFLDRNYNDIQVRFEVLPSANEAKDEVKTRVNRFVELYKTTPAYN